ncbi:MAG: iron-sulfur cluster repair di-iron protein [Acidobacteriota bacterium]
MQEFATKTIREIALEAPLTTRVFEEFKIDFCCGGRVPFAEACEIAGVDPTVMMSKLEAVINTARSEGVVAGDQRSPSELIEFIVSTHHEFTRDEFSRLLPLMDKVAGKHGENHPELFEIKRLFQELAADLMPHMQKEERVLFPYIEKVEAATEGRSPVPMASFGTVENPVRMMMFEHEAAGDLLRQMRSLSSDYTTPDGACPSYKGLYAGIEDLERDLHQHIHLENNVLFPQAIELENKLLSETKMAQMSQALL